MTKINCHSHKVAPHLQPRLAITREQGPSHVPAIECTALRPNEQTATAGNFCGAPSTWHKQAPSTWHAACLPRGETRYPHSAEYWQAGGPRSSSGLATEFAECVPRSKFPPPHMYLVVGGQWNFMVYRCDQIKSAYNAALSTLSYLVRARLGNATALSGISCRAKTWTHFSWWARCTK